MFRVIFIVIYQTRGRVFPPISKHREVGWKNEAQLSFFNQLPGVWKWEETLFLVFDISYINNSWLNTLLVLYFRAYEDLRVKHEPLLLITPQFETPLPPLQPAVSVKY